MIKKEIRLQKKFPQKVCWLRELFFSRFMSKTGRLNKLATSKEQRSYLILNCWIDLAIIVESMR